MKRYYIAENSPIIIKLILTLIILIFPSLFFILSGKDIKDINTFILKKGELIEIPCEIISSDVKKIVVRKGASYIVGNLKFSYEFDGQKYIGDKFQPIGQYFHPQIDVKLSDIQTIYPAGKKLSCYLHPDNPGRAILTKEFSNIQILWILIKFAGMVLFPLILISGIYSPQYSYSKLKIIITYAVINIFWNGICIATLLGLLYVITTGVTHPLIFFSSFFITIFLTVGIKYMLIPFIKMFFDASAIIEAANPNMEKLENDLIRDDKTFGIYFGIILLLIGCFFISANYIPSAWMWVEMRGWVKAPCEIISSDSQIVSNPISLNYKVSVKYKYQYSGKDYIGTRFQYYDIPSKYENHIIKLSTKAFQKNECFVNPSNPSVAVLSRNIAGVHIFGGAFIGPLFAFIGALFAYFSLKNHFKKNKIDMPPLTYFLRIIFLLFILFMFLIFLSALFITDYGTQEEKGRDYSFDNIMPFLIFGILFIMIFISITIYAAITAPELNRTEKSKFGKIYKENFRLFRK